MGHFVHPSHGSDSEVRCRNIHVYLFNKSSFSNIYVVVKISRLYAGARLVHGDLSEYNILVAPSFQVDNLIASTDDKDHDLQIVLIDFGQAVDIRHPESESLLFRDLDRVRSFFVKQGVTTLALDDALRFVKDEQHEENKDEETETPAEAAVTDTVEAMS